MMTPYQNRLKRAISEQMPTYDVDERSEFLQGLELELLATIADELRALRGELHNIDNTFNKKKVITNG